MPKRLDRKRPFGEIHGGVRVHYIQDDLEFDEHGHEIREPEPEKVPVDYSKLPIIQLRKLMTAHGGTYESKAQAAEFLGIKLG
jgi:hypothetical protein